MVKITSILFVILAFLCLLGFGVMWWLLRQLKCRQYVIWERLGKPGIFINNNIRNNLAVLRFIFTKENEKSGDEVIIRLAFFARIYILCYVCYFIIFLICAIMQM
jgi:hypothetical protein